MLFSVAGMSSVLTLKTFSSMTKRMEALASWCSTKKLF